MSVLHFCRQITTKNTAQSREARVFTESACGASTLCATSSARAMRSAVSYKLLKPAIDACTCGATC